jgi:hypothetical protein
MSTAVPVSSASSLPVDDDIIDRILTCVPTFDTLLSLILVSKSFFAVFKAHPNSIVRAVAYNVAGSALPQLIASIRTPDRPQGDEEDEELPRETNEVSPITNDEVKQIIRQTRVAQGLENIFSLRSYACLYK